MIFLCPKKTPIKSTANEMCVCVCVRKKERTIERASECFTVICNDIRLYSCNSCFTRICKYVYYTIIWNTIIYSLNGIVLFCTPRVRAVSLHPWKCPSETGQNNGRCSLYPVNFQMYNTTNDAAEAINRELFNRYFVLPRTIRQRVHVRAAIPPSLDQFAEHKLLFSLRGNISSIRYYLRIAYFSFSISTGLYLLTYSGVL